MSSNPPRLKFASPSTARSFRREDNGPLPLRWQRAEVQYGFLVAAITLPGASLLRRYRLDWLE